MEPKENHINETLNSLDGMGRAQANPYLFEKVMNRMHSASEAQRVKPTTVRMAFAVAVVLICANAFSLLHFNKSNSGSATGVSGNPVASEYFSYITNSNF